VKFKLLSVPALLTCSCLAASPAAQIPVTPLAFEPNVGQADAQVKYLAHASHGMLWLTEKGLVLSAGGKTGSVVRVRFEGGNAAPRIEAEDKHTGISNYFIGNDRRNWHTGVPQYGKVRYREVYPGIDVVFYGNPSNVEYDFVLRPGADPARIRLAFDGASKLTTDSDGGLVLRTGGAEIRNLPPVIRQDGKLVGGHWAVLGKNRAGFVVDRFDRSKPLIIDPVLTYASLVGGVYRDVIVGVAIDGQGNIIAGGITNSPDFPLARPFDSVLEDTSGGSVYPFVLKINPSAAGPASLVYSTFFASAGILDEGSTLYAITADLSGNAYFTGSAGDNLPVEHALPGQGTYNSNQQCLIQGEYTYCDHGFVAELNSAGNQLLFSSYLGGSKEDQGYAIAVDATGNIYVGGVTQSSDFPTMGNFVQGSLQGSGTNGFVSVISPSHTLTYSTFFSSGGSQDGVNTIAVDSSGRIFLAGDAGGSALPVANGFQPTYPGGANHPSAAFAAILNPSLPQPLLYSTYLGGSDHESSANAVATDGAGNIYVVGQTQATDFPVAATAVRGPGAGANPKAFVAKLNPAAQGKQQLVYSTILGGSFIDIAQAVAVGPSGRITVAGETNSLNFELTSNAYQQTFVAGETASGPTPIGFLAQIDPTQSGSASLLYSSFLGSPNSILYGVALDSTGNIVVVGGEATGGPPLTPSAFQSAYGGGASDGYIARFDMSQTGPAITSVENGASLSADTNGMISPGMIVTVKGTGLGPSVATAGSIDPTSGKVSTNVAGVEVLIDNTPCPLLYISATQVNAVAPYELAAKAGQAVAVQVIYNQGSASTVYKIVSATNPGIISFDDGSGQGAILNQDGTVNGPSNPAARGSLVQIFATGEGQTVPPGVDGVIANEPVASIPHPAAALSLTIGGVAVPTSSITYAGTLPGGVAGALQINAMIPANAPTGSAIPIVLTIGANSSPNTLTMAVQ
jgi:uncharacterized protein (TIGR03437 family)